jgi:hypothetical protein
MRYLLGEVMKNLLKNKVALQVVLLVVIIGVISTPIGQQYAGQIQPIIEALLDM